MAKRDVVRLLVRLFGDPKLAERLQKDAEKVMKGAKLTAAERRLLASGDARAIQAYLGGDSVKANIKSKFLMANIKSKTSIANIKSKFKK